MRILFVVLLFLLGANAVAQTPSSILNKIVVDAKDVYVKGSYESVDGGQKSLFFVYPIDTMKADNAELVERFKRRVTLDMLVDAVPHIYGNANKRFVYPWLIEFGVDWSRPWRSLKKIPQAFDVAFSMAPDNYYGTNNISKGLGTVAGRAAIATVKSLYYLILEVPATAIATAIRSIPATPVFLGTDFILAPLVIGNEAVKIVIPNAFERLKIAFLKAYGYGSSVAGAATIATGRIFEVLISGGWLIFKNGVSYLWDIPDHYPNEYQQVYDTQVDQFATRDIGRDVERFLEFQKGPLELTRIEKKAGKYKTRFDLFTDWGGIEVKAGTIFVKVEEHVFSKNVVIDSHYNLAAINGESLMRFDRSIKAYAGALRKTASPMSPFCSAGVSLVD